MLSLQAGVSASIKRSDAPPLRRAGPFRPAAVRGTPAALPHMLAAESAQHPVYYLGAQDYQPVLWPSHVLACMPAQDTSDQAAAV